MKKGHVPYGQIVLAGLSGTALTVAVVALARANRHGAVDIVVPWEHLDTQTRQEVALTIREGRDRLNARLQHLINMNIRSQHAAAEGNMP